MNIQFIVVLPYTETSRLFHASKSTEQEAFIGETAIEYYQSKARVMSEQDAKTAVLNSANPKAFIRQIN